MPGGAIIAIDQDRPGGTSYGVPGVARKDLWRGHTVRPRCTTSPNTSFLWELLDVPPSSGAAITPGTETLIACDFISDAEDSYRLQLTTSGGGPGNVQILILAVTRDETGVLLHDEMRIPAVREQGTENNFNGQTDGWAPAVRDILEFAREGGGGGGGTGADGAPGSVWRSGSSVPSNALGIDGDFYLRTETGAAYKRAAGVYTQVANLKGPAGAAATPEELTPIDLDLHEVSNQAVFNFMPAALLDVNDDMSDATLTRFTTLSEGTPQTPTISGGQMTLAHPSGGDKNTGLQEGQDIAICQVASSINIVSRTGGAGNAYENIGVGIAKDANNFILAVWQRVGTTAAIQVKIAGAANFRASVGIATWTPPFELGFSLVANSLTMWRRAPGAAWTKITSYDVSGTFNFKTSDLTGWKGAFWLATQSALDVTFVFDDFKVGRFGSVGFRDPSIVMNEDGTARLTGSQVTLTATCTDTQAAGYCAVFTLDLATRLLTQTGVLMVNRGGQMQNDCAAHIIAYNDATYQFFITTWGNFGGAADTIQVLYKNETSLNLLSGAHLVGGMTQLNLPLPSNAGAYDPSVVKVGATWYLAYTVGPGVAATFYPALASSADLVTWALVGSDPASFPYEGTRIAFLADDYWVMSANLDGTNVYDLTMVFQGRMDSLVVAGPNPGHPMLVPYGQYIYQVTFDDTLFGGVTNTVGHFRQLRARRYGDHG